LAWVPASAWAESIDLGASISGRSFDQGRFELNSQQDLTSYLAVREGVGVGVGSFHALGLADVGLILKADYVSLVPELGASVGALWQASTVSAREQAWVGGRWYVELDWAVGLTVGAEYNEGRVRAVAQVFVWRSFF